MQRQRDKNLLLYVASIEDVRWLWATWGNVVRRTNGTAERRQSHANWGTEVYKQEKASNRRRLPFAMTRWHLRAASFPIQQAHLPANASLPVPYEHSPQCPGVLWRDVEGRSGVTTKGELIPTRLQGWNIAVWPRGQTLSSGRKGRTEALWLTLCN
jgi:hypothetical protein